MTARPLALAAFAGAISFARGATAADAEIPTPDAGILADESLLDPPPMQLTQELAIALEVEPFESWCGPTCPEESLQLLLVGPRSTFFVAAGIRVSVVAGPVLMMPRNGSVGPEGATIVELEKEIGSAGILKLGVGYARRFDFDG
jgi:hypothetical protein